jgi:hypothetical protein
MTIIESGKKYFEFLFWPWYLRWSGNFIYLFVCLFGLHTIRSLLTNETNVAAMQRGCRSVFSSCSHVHGPFMFISYFSPMEMKWVFLCREIFWVSEFLFYPSFTSPPFPRSTKPSKIRRRELTEEENDEIKEAFELFDNDKDNELDYHEFKVSYFYFPFSIHLFFY